MGQSSTEKTPHHSNSHEDLRGKSSPELTEILRTVGAELDQLNTQKGDAETRLQQIERRTAALQQVRDSAVILLNNQEQARGNRIARRLRGGRGLR